MTTQPAPKTQELENNINYFLDNYLRPTPLEIRRLKKDAENLKNSTGYDDYYDFLGRIAVLENDREAVISNCENAIKNSANDYVIHRNYSVALFRCGLNDLALKEARKVFNKFTNNKAVLLDFLIRSARFDEAHKLLCKIENNKHTALINNVVKLFESENLTDDEAQHLQTLAFSLIEKYQLYFYGADIEIIENCVEFIIYVDKPIEDIFDLNWELANLLAESVDDMCCDVLNFTYSSVDVLREKIEHERKKGISHDSF